jgi:hypothetical protein
MLLGETPQEVSTTNTSPIPSVTLARPPVTERITVALIPAAGRQLRELQKRTHLSKTDLANRAITSYEFMEAALSAGHDLILRNNKTGETHIVRLI